MLMKHCLQEFKLDCQLRRLSDRTIKGYYNNRGGVAKGSGLCYNKEKQAQSQRSGYYAVDSKCGSL